MRNMSDEDRLNVHLLQLSAHRKTTDIMTIYRIIHSMAPIIYDLNISIGDKNIWPIFAIENITYI